MESLFLSIFASSAEIGYFFGNFTLLPVWNWPVVECTIFSGLSGRSFSRCPCLPCFGWQDLIINTGPLFSRHFCSTTTVLCLWSIAADVEKHLPQRLFSPKKGAWSVWRQGSDICLLSCITHKCSEVHTWRAGGKCRLNSSPISVTTSKYVLMKIAGYFSIHILVDFYYKYVDSFKFICNEKIILGV